MFLDSHNKKTPGGKKIPPLFSMVTVQSLFFSKEGLREFLLEKLSSISTFQRETERLPYGQSEDQKLNN